MRLIYDVHALGANNNAIGENASLRAASLTAVKNHQTQNFLYTKSWVMLEKVYHFTFVTRYNTMMGCDPPRRRATGAEVIFLKRSQFALGASPPR